MIRVLTMTSTAEQISFALRHLAFAQRNLMDSWVDTGGLTQQQAVTLGWIEANEGVIAKDVARRSGTTPASVASLLQGLQDRGLITREPSPTDARVKLLRVTPEGSRLVAGFGEQMIAATREFFSTLTADEQRTYLDLTLRLLHVDSLDGLGAPDRRP